MLQHAGLHFSSSCPAPPQVQTNAFTVIFDERFSVPMDLSSLEEYSLRFAAFGIDSDERNISAGVAELKLLDLDLTIRLFNAWLYLQDVNKVRFWRHREQSPSSGHLEELFCSMFLGRKIVVLLENGKCRCSKNI